MIKTIYFKEEAVMLLDQSRLPGKITYQKCNTPEDVAQAIQNMKVRGAPLIGITAAFGMALAVCKYAGPPGGMDSYFKACKELLASTRPTAVNLFWALDRIETLYRDKRGLAHQQLCAAMLKEAQKMCDEDISINKAIGGYGEGLLPAGCRVLTICNAGALATCGYGTALGVVRTAAARDKILKVWACETRPILQGARLTVWELMQDGIPVTLITDSMAGYVMKLGEVDAIIVGADRIAANGDTANKIGTYTLAVLASFNNIPFYVAAPLSTCDFNISSGNDIVIEQRPHDEVRKIEESYLTLPDADVFNPAFDITPNTLITAIITEKGVVRPPYTEGLKNIRKGQ